MFLGTESKVYILDKDENNPLRESFFKPALTAEFDLITRKCRPMKTETNQFCAGGGALGDGSWVSLGGNPPYLYGTKDGLQAIRRVTPCNDKSCQFRESKNFLLQRKRWYPSVETMPDGSLAAFAGADNNVFIPLPWAFGPAGTTNTVEFVPSKGPPRDLKVLARADPFSLYPLTTLLSNGEVFITAGNLSVAWNPDSNNERFYPEMPNGPRNYPSGGAYALLPMKPSDGYKQTILYCGGTNLPKWSNRFWSDIPPWKYDANNKCDTITPLGDGQWKSTESLPQNLVMGNAVILPDGKIWMGNGARKGTQGFGLNGLGDSYSDVPARTPYIYDPEASSGQRWTRGADMRVPRMYHSSALLLPDGSILTAGSNPHGDSMTWAAPYPTEYRLEVFYPDYYDQPRPSNDQLPDKLDYGGAKFTVKFKTKAEASAAVIRVIRPAFSTHGLQMGQRSIELVKKVSSNGLDVTFENMPTNRALYPPGPAMVFLVVNGIPSQGKWAIVGSGQAHPGFAGL